ncbi:hypothetical protein Sj15T_09900 [Sphingobium sp. TA15]|uniref:Uncharacterized protein n=1 Tax=Sphingobium indicum (strain DSM 16413 / CCM 7287 / MTCC 6362 / UT26 / NBRC 101211 / UT26S) TaxID=452662 RepID=D4Z8R0_SPHIU|nr:hypothetical protein [Sphingobium indicum]BAI98992.1 hypothetical protein SJA_P1-00400 [Sphingobium indicum UT26S]BDD65969.1 hypothetical protein Sj15T_09900 [Sphingobium sp. TA15]
MTTLDLAERIIADFACAESRLRLIKPVPHHEWLVPPGELYWFAGDVPTSVAHGASIFLRRTPADPLLEDQIHIEVRLFWDEPWRMDKPATHRAILWCERGPRFFGRSTSLIGSGASFFYACCIEHLCEDVIEAIGTALYVWNRLREGTRS